jgi:hypothetical protein
MFTAHFEGTFVKQLQERRAKWAATPNEFGAVIRLVDQPFNMNWWYYHEFGAKPHDIASSTGGKVVYTSGGVTHIVEIAHHPGNKPLHVVGTLLSKIAQEAQEAIHQALTSGGADDPELVKKCIFKAVENAKEFIAVGYEKSLPGSRPPDPEYPKQSGKLQGHTAAEVYREQAVVEPFSR